MYICNLFNKSIYNNTLKKPFANTICNSSLIARTQQINLQHQGNATELLQRF